MRPSDATFGIKQGPIPSHAHAGCHRADEVRAAMKKFLERKRGIQIASLHSCCAEVGLDAPDKSPARALGCTERTIKAHRKRVMEKMQVRSLPELVSLAERAGALGGVR